MLCNFPKILSNLRREKGLSQKSAALELGISPALLSHYENGIRECGLDFLLRISEYYGVSCDYLLGKSAIKNPIVYEVEPEASALDSVLKIARNHNLSIHEKLSKAAAIDIYRISRTLCDSASRSSVFYFAYEEKDYKNLCNAAESRIYSSIHELGKERKKLQPVSDNYSQIITIAEKEIKKVL